MKIGNWLLGIVLLMALAGMVARGAFILPFQGGGSGSCVNGQLDYFGLVNWDVTRGCVDLVGVGGGGIAFNDIVPGNGLYLDLAGTESTNAIGGEQPARLESKTEFSFVSGKDYRLRCYIAGINVPLVAGATFECLISVTGGQLAEQTVTVTDYEQPFTLYTYTWTAGSSGTGQVVFDMQEHSYYDDAEDNQRIGLPLDRVTLENVTDAVMMLDDDFDDENPCP